MSLVVLVPLKAHLDSIQILRHQVAVVFGVGKDDRSLLKKLLFVLNGLSAKLGADLVEEPLLVLVDLKSNVLILGLCRNNHLLRLLFYLNTFEMWVKVLDYELIVPI